MRGVLPSVWAQVCFRVDNDHRQLWRDDASAVLLLSRNAVRTGFVVSFISGSTQSLNNHRCRRHPGACRYTGWVNQKRIITANAGQFYFGHAPCVPLEDIPRACSAACCSLRIFLSPTRCGEATPLLFGINAC